MLEGFCFLSRRLNRPGIPRVGRFLLFVAAVGRASTSGFERAYFRRHRRCDGFGGGFRTWRGGLICHDNVSLASFRSREYDVISHLTLDRDSLSY